ncbi:hypothetical protein M1O16_04940 [Dehalococcoidia bacterium]|nr:hypothetical protein [Dehalococcoidia bacterium]
MMLKLLIYANSEKTPSGSATAIGSRVGFHDGLASISRPIDVISASVISRP